MDVVFLFVGLFRLMLLLLCFPVLYEFLNPTQKLGIPYRPDQHEEKATTSFAIYMHKGDI